MRRLLLATTLLFPFAAQAQQIGSFADSSALAAMTSALGAAPSMALTYVDSAQPMSNFLASGQYEANQFASTYGPNTIPILGLPIAGAGQDADAAFKAIANGSQDAMITGVLQAFADKGYQNIILRPGYEMNGGWFSWTVTEANAADFKAAFQRIATLAHNYQNALVSVNFNPNSGASIPLQDYYPGNAYVDSIGLDLNSQPWSSDTAPTDTNGSPTNLTLNYVMQFAKDNGKPFALPETGAGANDTTFPQQLTQAIQAAGTPILFAGLWDSNSVNNAQWTDNPAATAAWVSFANQVKLSAPPGGAPVATPTVAASSTSAGQASAAAAGSSASAQTCSTPAPAAGAGYTVPVISGPVALGSTWQAIPGANVTQNGDGSVTIAGGGSPYNSQVGTTQSTTGGFYFEATMSWTGTATWLPGNGWPSAWGTNAAAGLGMTNTEIDVEEAMSGADAYNGGMHNWNPDGSDSNTGGLTGANIRVPAGTDFSQPHTYGLLSIPATATTQGSAAWYFDGKAVQTVPISQGGLFSTLATEPITWMVGSGTVNPLTVYNVNVWQAPGGGSSSAPAVPTSSGATPCPTPSTLPNVAAAGPSGSALQKLTNGGTTPANNPIVPSMPVGTCATVGTGAGASGPFTTQNGLIIGANGQPFQARGVDVMWGGDVPSADALTKTFPGINFVRLAVYDYSSPSALSTYVNSLTSKGIVVELENHNNNAGNAGGGQGSIFTGSALTQESNWYASVASAFKNNPNVWFGTNNEPSETNAAGQQDPAALSQWQLSTYNAIRGTGNANPIMVEISTWANNGQPQVAVGYSPSVYAQMTNVIGDIHYYGWLTGGSTDQATNSNFLAQMIQQTHQLTTASGPMPALIGEYGPSTTGQDPADPNSQQVISAVQSSGVGNVAWAYTNGTVGQDALLFGGGGFTSYGQEVQAYITASANSCPGVAAIASVNNTDTGPSIASSPAADTDPINITAPDSSAQYLSIAGPPATDIVPVAMGAAPSTAIDTTPPVDSSHLANALAEQVVPTFGNGASGSAAATSAAPPQASTSSNPSGDPTFSTDAAPPQQVVPKYAGGYPASGGITTPATQADGTVNGTPATYTTSPSTDPSGTAQLQTLMAQSYGQTAVTTADQLGVNASSVAAIAKVESNFQNIGTANGSTTATGPWQFTQGTFNTVSQNYNLGFSSANLTNPNAQATAAPYYLQQIASTIGTATGQPATTLQAYGGWVFGPDAGASIANASSTAPLSSIVSAQSLANNGMSNWTVGDFRSAMSTRLGAASNQTVLTTKGI